jgi:hypothetical protein
MMIHGDSLPARIAGYQDSGYREPQLRGMLVPHTRMLFADADRGNE